jgi:hypothetical protein
LIASQLSAPIALIVLWSTDFFGDQPSGSRAKAMNDAGNYSCPGAPAPLNECLTS